MSDPVVLTELAAGVVELRLNRPAKKNALTVGMLEAFCAALDDLAGKSRLRAVVLCGGGGDFCAGMDTGALAAMAGAGRDEISRMMQPLPGHDANLFQRPVQALRDLSVPVIAALDGVCFGAGLQIALGADFRIAAPEARLSIMETKWGLIPDMGLSLTLPRLMPIDRAKLLIMQADILDGVAARDHGLVTALAEDPHGTARDLAARLAARSPDAMRAAKRLAEGVWPDAGGAGLSLEVRLQAGLIGQPDQVETVAAILQKRSARYG